MGLYLPLRRAGGDLFTCLGGTPPPDSSIAARTQGKYTSEVAALQQAVRSRDDRINHLEMDVVGLQARADAASTSAASLSEQVSQLTAAHERTKVSGCID